MAKLVSPSLLAADFNKLQEDIEVVNNSRADWFHLDIMDGVFVPNISLGFPFIKHVKKLTKKPLDVHLMTVEPQRHIHHCKDAGADIVTVHYEACTHLHRTLQEIRQAGMKPGVAINPHTSVLLLEDIITEVDLVLIMSVNPGFGGQNFISNSLKKVSQLKRMIVDSESKALIQIDGGVRVSNAEDIVAAGVDCLVAGSAIFGSNNKFKVIEDLKNA